MSVFTPAHLWLLPVGLLVGIFAGVFGVGGGIIVVPVLAILFGFDQHAAQGTSLAMIVPVAFISALTYRYHDARHVSMHTAALLAVGAIVGGYLGAKIAHLMSAPLLQRVFALLIMFFAIRMLFFPNQQDKATKHTRTASVSATAVESQ